MFIPNKSFKEIYPIAFTSMKRQVSTSISIRSRMAIRSFKVLLYLINAIGIILTVQTTIALGISRKNLSIIAKYIYKVIK